nr:phosphotransferase family protein [Aquicoccus sp. G2-2]MEA1112167.1 phosphotransferase family protein [Aquicoccus sp. G2-2]
MTTSPTLTNQTPDCRALEAWMTTHVAGFHGPLTLSKFAGGQSNPTFRIDAPSGRYVLRRKPLGPVLPSAHAVDREFRVLSALRDSDVPVARVHALCLDEAVLGSIFYVMDFVDGRIFWDPRLPDLLPDERAAIFASMNTTIAAIHTLDPNEIGLTGFGRSEDYLKRQIARWTRQFEASRTGPNPAMDNLIDWLPAHVPRNMPRVWFTAITGSTTC